MNREHHILIITKNTNGIVARIMSLFNRRGYFVKKMSAGVTNKDGYARLTLTVAEINILLDGEKEVSASYGSGPVDASYKAINRILNDNFILEEYKLESITGDTDAQAQVVVIIEKNGKRYIGRAQSTDIVEASIKAYINALNRLYQN